ncbi:MAG: mevalonate kinase [Polyangiaceae bacterium]
MKGRGAGKVILLGEHAVVYGVPALAVGIDRGATAWLTGEGASSTAPASLSIPTWNIFLTEADEVPLALAFRALLEVTRRETGNAFEGVSLEADGDLPPGGGLGSSAAVGVAVARALDPAAPSDVIEARVMAWERVFHGNPSGIDAAVASRGGCIYFTRGGIVEPVLTPSAIHLCIGDSGTSSATKAMVESVAKRKAQNPELVEKAWSGIRSLVENGRLALQDGDMRAVGKLLDLNQMILSGLFLSTPEIETLCKEARAAGALGSKLTGAGGGGCVVALVESGESASRVLEAWKTAGFSGFHTCVATTVSVEPPLRRAVP